LQSDLFDLAAREIRIWPVWLRAEADEADACRAVLDAEETAAFGRRSGKVASEYLFSHAVLRFLAGGYASVAPAEVHFAFGSKGKPRIDTMPAPFHFNVSHSGGAAIFAFTRDCEIGIDIEQIRPFADMSDIARHYFCREETAQLSSLDEASQVEAFFRCWTRKEAYIKAEGEGLSLPLDGFQVTLLPGQAPCFVHIGNDTQAERAWTLHALDVIPGCAGALAYRDASRPLQVRPLESAGDLIRRIRHASSKSMRQIPRNSGA
jgi:4'-phosphopantetheinyl transferase